MRNKIITKFLLMLLIVVFMSTASVNALSSYNTDEQVYMHDLADILTPSEEAELIKLTQGYCDGKDFNVLFLTTDSTDGLPTVSYSNYYANDFFPDDVDNNIIFVIDMDNREYNIDTMGETIQIITDAEIDEAMDNAASAMSNQDFARAFKNMATYCLSDVVQSSNSGFINIFLSLMLSNILWSLIPTAIVVVLLIIRHNAANKQQPATQYLSKDNYAVITKDERFVRTYETIQKDYYKPKSSGSSSGGSSGHMSGGRAHGGGSRKF